MNQILLRVAIFFLALPATARAAVPVLENEHPAHAPEVIELEEIWRVGGEDEAPAMEIICCRVKG